MGDSEYRILIYGSYFLGSIAFVVLINFIFLRFAQNLGIRTKVENDDRWSHQPKPAFGGISFYIIFLLSFTSYAIFFRTVEAFPNTVMFGLIAATAFAFLMGLADDAFNTRPFLKLGVQILSGLALIYTGTYIQWFENEFLNYTLTIFWVVGLMNAINMLDNMDAITALIAIAILTTTMVLMILTNGYENIYFFTLIGVLASLLGFLFFNWHPSKLFMGDTGSQFLGIFLAFIGIRYFWNIEWIAYSPSWFSSKFILLLAMFALPIIDTSVVVINRLLRGQSPMIGGKDHTTHSFSFLGFNDRQIAYVFGSIAFLMGFLIIAAVVFQQGYYKAIEIVILLSVILIFILFYRLNRSYLKSKLYNA